MLTAVEEAMTPKRRHSETGAEVKPEARMVIIQGKEDVQPRFQREPGCDHDCLSRAKCRTTCLTKECTTVVRLA